MKEKVSLKGFIAYNGNQIDIFPNAPTGEEIMRIEYQRFDGQMSIKEVPLETFFNHITSLVLS